MGLRVPDQGPKKVKNYYKLFEGNSIAHYSLINLVGSSEELTPSLL